MKELALRAIVELMEKHEPEFVILYGSVARGDFTEDSDIDVACFCRSPKVKKDVRMFEGRKLDCWIYTCDEAKPEKNSFLRFVGGEIFEDKEGNGRIFLDKVCLKYEAGPELVSADSRNHLVEWSKHTLKRAMGNDIDANFRRVSLPCELLEIYFKLRNMWYEGPKNSFSWLKENDSKAFYLFEKIFTNPADIEVLAQLVEATIETKILNVPSRNQAAK